MKLRIDATRKTPGDERAISFSLFRILNRRGFVLQRQRSTGGVIPAIRLLVTT